MIHFQTDVNLSSYNLIVFDGKKMKENAERYNISNSYVSLDIVSMMELFLAQTSALYQKGVLTPDCQGQKLFHNINQKSKQVTNRRLKTSVVTKLLKGRLQTYFA